MDYKKANAPINTTVHDLIEMAQPTGNIYETVAIIGKRANQHSTITSKRFLRTGSKLRSRSTTRSCPSPPLSQRKSIATASSCIAT